MFTAARLKLTSWYLLIIMLISLTFSAVIYQVFHRELGRSLGTQGNRLIIPDNNGLYYGPRRNGTILVPNDLSTLNQRIQAEADQRIRRNLLLANLAILVLSAVIGYFLAGRTLQPIEVMVEEQKQFTGDASHELRTPLTALKTSIEVGLRDKELKLAEAKQLLKSNLEEVERLQVLASHLLTMDRYDNLSDLAEAAEPIDFRQVFEAASERVGAAAAAKSIELVYLDNDQPVTLVAAVPPLTDLLAIFMDNAIKYSPEQTSVEVAAKTRGQQVAVEIRDSGVGIAPKDLPYIFNRFYQAESSRNKAESTGFGLGLSMAQKIVQALHGSIGVKSKPGIGTTFRLILPKEPYRTPWQKMIQLLRRPTTDSE